MAPPMDGNPDTMPRGHGWGRLRLGSCGKLETTDGVRVCSDARNLLDNPPDSVDLSALAPGVGKMVSPEECRAIYQEAFSKAGGNPALQACMTIVNTLDTKMKEASSDHCGWNRSLHARQLQVWQSYGLDFMMKKIGDGSAVRLHGERLLLDLGNEVKQHVDSSAVLLIAEPKQWSRSSIKVRIKYASDCSQLGDLNRATLVCPDIKSMYAAAELIFERWGPTVCRQQARIVEFEDHYREPMSGGYRHLQMLICISGSIWELQLNTAPMQDAKAKAGHKLYKTTRFVQEMMLFASMEGDVGVLRELLSEPGVREIADPNAVRDGYGLSALHHAAFRGDLDVLMLLLSKDCLKTCADAWAFDNAKCGGLPLNYAMQMQHHNVALILVQHMAEQSVSQGTLAPATKARLAEATAAAVDYYETTSMAGENSAPHKESEELLRSLVRLWNVICGSEAFKGIDPFTYAFSINAKCSTNVFFEFADLWLVDKDGMLPIERAISLGVQSAAENCCTRMLASRPDRFPPEATWSLARCRGKGRFPEALVGEVMISDLLLRHMADNIYAPQHNHNSHTQDRRSLRDQIGGWPENYPTRQKGGSFFDVDLTKNQTKLITMSTANHDLPPVSPPLRKRSPQYVVQARTHCGDDLFRRPR